MMYGQQNVNLGTLSSLMVPQTTTIDDNEICVCKLKNSNKTYFKLMNSILLRRCSHCSAIYILLQTKINAFYNV